MKEEELNSEIILLNNQIKLKKQNISSLEREIFLEK